MAWSRFPRHDTRSRLVLYRRRPLADQQVLGKRVRVLDRALDRAVRSPAWRLGTDRAVSSTPTTLLLLCLQARVLANANRGADWSVGGARVLHRPGRGAAAAVSVGVAHRVGRRPSASATTDAPAVPLRRLRSAPLERRVGHGCTRPRSAGCAGGQRAFRRNLAIVVLGRPFGSRSSAVAWTRPAALRVSSSAIFVRLPGRSE